ncbi:hypothetical protein PF005_g16364 [Phytophthora fragariae]|uniref:Cytochrome c oxidase subunit n=2 Tax=Phytophthora TaxID=4783 RepID=A0A6A3EF24_9STRA|nr:hypothetical protein PF003_g30863 [Phytophthora fragariae]KAE9012162.1 hypothetical protein PR002_g14876 [Phytophthora rubi]KAE8932205.1 hypothetical protein PF009_g17753 [Phytophthora fragariae]KAE8988641.1 hypothetical protein PF011_g19087 [Phytophthora fragariae]KAE9017535.1 hypothetical protein PR001_g14369 [Phytophthora rubi]
MPAGEAKLKTTPLDPRFPNTNQAQHCWTRYNEYVLCLKNNDGDEDTCKKYFQHASSICPNSWTDRWNEQREEGTFQGVQYFKEE